MFLKYVSNTWDGLSLFMVIGYSIFGILSFAQLQKCYKLKFRIDKNHIRDGLAFGAPLIVYVFAQSMIDLSDRYFIAEMVGVEYAGIYNIAYKFGMINFFLFKFFQQAWNPHMFEVLEKGSTSKKLGLIKQTLFISLGILFLAFLVALIAPIYVRIFLAEEYHVAIPVIPWICAAYGFRSIYGLNSGFIFFKKRTVHLSTLTLINALINLVLNYFLILEYGFIGAAIATLITFIFSNLLLILLMVKDYRSEINQLIKNVELFKE